MFLFQESICLIWKLMSYLAAVGLMGYTIQFRIVCRTVCVVSSYVLLPANTPMMMGLVIAEIGLVSHKTCLVVLSTHTHTHIPPSPLCRCSGRCTNNKNNFYDSLRILFRISSAINVALNNPSIPAWPIPPPFLFPLRLLRHRRWQSPRMRRDAYKNQRQKFWVIWWHFEGINLIAFNAKR